MSAFTVQNTVSERLMDEVHITHVMDEGTREQLETRGQTGTRTCEEYTIYISLR